MVSYVVYVLAAGVKTHPNRYLLIATSGGLNQQRTGVSFLKQKFQRAASAVLLLIGIDS